MMIPTTTILVANGRSDSQSLADFNQLAIGLAARFEQPVLACALDDGQSSLMSAISGALRAGAVRLVVVPLLLSPAEYRGNTVAESISFASRRFPFLQFHLAPPIAWDAWANLLDLRGLHNLKGLALILAAQHDTPAVNSDLAKLVRLINETNEVDWVELAFVGENGRSALPAVLNRVKILGAEKCVVVPWVLFAGMAVNQIKTITDEEPNTTVIPHLGGQPALLDLLAKQHQLALADRSLLPISWEEIEQQLAAELYSHDKVKRGQAAPDEDEYQQLNAKINAILPPRYQDKLDEVSAAPMSAADLVFDEDGQVAWDEIFGFDDPDSPFCELALAGGPSHRGELLEAVTTESCVAEMGKYTAVISEIERGIQMVTSLPTVKSDALGWVGVVCDSDEMAIWLVRAIIVENVMVRRQGNVLYLPAGPQFTLKNEIKSIVTVTAKTWHYWIEHVTYREMAKVTIVS